MPEGDTIHRLAARLNRAIRHDEIRRCWTALSDVDDEKVVGAHIAAIEARGKHLLIHLDVGNIFHIHLGREGKYRFGMPDDGMPQTQRDSLILVTQTLSIRFTHLPIFEYLTAWQYRRHPHLNRLGPDLLADDLHLKEVVARFRMYGHQSIAEAIMNQRICCGVGNIYKSEVLFLAGLSPRALVSQLADDTLERLISDARRWMARNLGTGRRRTRWRPGPSHWVYGRSGERCLKCDAVIRMRRLGEAARSTYFCPNCQSEVPLGRGTRD